MLKLLKTQFLIALLTALLLSCGTNKVVKPPDVGVLNINNLRTQNNVLSFTTDNDAFVHIVYTNRNINNETYTGWSAGSKGKNHSYTLPVQSSGNTYNIKLTVSNENAHRDTTFTFVSTNTPQSLMAVHFINVRQGDATLIKTPEGKHIQIDGGYGRQTANHLNATWQGGGQPLALNYLQSQNITHIDYIIETHRHIDHWGGLSDIVASSITNDYYVSNSTPLGYTAGDYLNMDSAVKFQILNIGYPAGSPQDNVNNTSIVVKAVYGDAEFLFTGDAMSDVQDFLYEQGYDISVDVLKVSHHGAHTHNTSNAEFLSKTLNQYAQIAILSYGAGNPYGHPASLQRCSHFQTYGTNAVTSAPPGNNNNYHFDCGDIIVYTDGKMIYVTY